MQKEHKTNGIKTLELLRVSSLYEKSEAVFARCTYYQLYKKIFDCVCIEAIPKELALVIKQAHTHEENARKIPTRKGHALGICFVVCKVHTSLEAPAGSRESGEVESVVLLSTGLGWGPLLPLTAVKLSADQLTSQRWRVAFISKSYFENQMR